MPLVAFDFDGTLSEDEMIVRLGEQAGCAGAIAEITERAMAGELSYAESLRERVALLEGLDEAAAERAYASVDLRPGAADLLDALQSAGVTTAILTGGFAPGVEAALGRAGTDVDRVVANRLATADGVLTGEVEGPLVDVTKGEALRRIAEAVGADLGDVAAVGDGANDVPMLDVAGLAIGFRPQPAIEPHCDAVVETMADLGSLLAEAGFC